MTAEIKSIAEEVKKILQEEALNQRKEQEIQKINDQIAQIEGDSNLKQEEKELHLSVLNFQKKRAELAYTDLEKAKSFSQKEQEYNLQKEVKVLRISAPQGNSVMELRIPGEAMENFETLLIASKEYWEELTEMIDNE